MSWPNAGAAEARVLSEAMTFCIAAVGLLCIWTTLSRRHCFARVSTVVLAIVALLPIRAYEPALLLLVVATAALIRMALVRRMPGPALAVHQSASRSVGARVSFVTCLVIAVSLSLAYVGPNSGRG